MDMDAHTVSQHWHSGFRLPACNHARQDTSTHALLPHEQHSRLQFPRACIVCRVYLIRYLWGHRNAYAAPIPGYAPSRPQREERQWATVMQEARKTQLPR